MSAINTIFQNAEAIRRRYFRYTPRVRIYGSGNFAVRSDCYREGWKVWLFTTAEARDQFLHQGVRCGAPSGCELDHRAVNL
jgi:hypothetical protein